MRILIVEDDIPSQVLLQKHLKDFGDVNTASDGQEAVEAVHRSLKENNPYKLILLDINMPEIDGLNTLSIIRLFEDLAGVNYQDSTKVIMVTALDDTKTILRAFREQCEAYLVKPISKDKLFTELKKLKFID